MEDLRIAQWLDAKITEDGTKIQELAKYVGVSVSQVSKWKSGDQAPRKPEHVFKIASFYSVDPMRLLATADPAFREQGIKPLPIPDVDHEHMLSKVPRYVGKRERRLMGRIAQLGSAARGQNGSDDPVGGVERYFTAIDGMLDTIQEMLDEGEVPGESEQPGRGGEAGPVDAAGRSADGPDRDDGRKGGDWRSRIAAPHLPTLPDYLAPFG